MSSIAITNEIIDEQVRRIRPDLVMHGNIVSKAMRDVWAKAVASGIHEPGDMVWSRVVSDADSVWQVLHQVNNATSFEDFNYSLTTSIFKAEELPVVEPAYDRWKAALDKLNTSALFGAAQQSGMTFIDDQHHHYPVGLRDLENAPDGLWAIGHTEALAEPRSVTITGARAADQNGLTQADEFAVGLADQEQGHVIVTGGGFGIETAALAATIREGKPSVTYLASGLDRREVAVGAEMYQRATEHGVLVSELPPGTVASIYRQLQRNRLMAAHANATVIVQAGAKSRTLNTASHAKALDRVLAAVPGFPNNPVSAGTRELISERLAFPVHSADEIAELVGHYITGTLPLPEQVRLETPYDEAKREMVKSGQAQTYPELLREAQIAQQVWDIDPIATTNLVREVAFERNIPVPMEAVYGVKPYATADGATEQVDEGMFDTTLRWSDHTTMVEFVGLDSARQPILDQDNAMALLDEWAATLPEESRPQITWAEKTGFQVTFRSHLHSINPAIAEEDERNSFTWRETTYDDSPGVDGEDRRHLWTNTYSISDLPESLGIGTQQSKPAPTGFWNQIGDQLDRIASDRPDSFDKVRAILNDPNYADITTEINRNGTREFDTDTAFFAGSGGDSTVRGALWEAGWQTVQEESRYHFAMQHPKTGETLTYCEGDLTRGLSPALGTPAVQYTPEQMQAQSEAWAAQQNAAYKPPMMG